MAKVSSDLKCRNVKYSKSPRHRRGQLHMYLENRGSIYEPAEAGLFFVDADRTLTPMLKLNSFICLCIYHTGKMCQKFDHIRKDF